MKALSWYTLFRAGLSDVIGLDWLRMFSSKELSTLISGAEHEISVSDLQAHTNYSGGYEMNHPTITAFWQVVAGFDEEQKRSLLKFVTSCSRPPLLGFKVCNIHLSHPSHKYDNLSGSGSSFLYSECWGWAREASNSLHMYEPSQASRFQGKNHVSSILHSGPKI